MNIITNPLQNTFNTFGAKKKTEITFTKIPLTDVEAEFDEILLKFHHVESDIRTQRQNLKDMYSAQGRFDYKELQKERQRLLAKLKRIAKKEAKEYYEIESDIAIKKQYNRFAPKAFRAKTCDEIKQVFQLINSYPLYKTVKDMLIQIIQQKKGLK